MIRRRREPNRCDGRHNGMRTSPVVARTTTRPARRLLLTAAAIAVLAAACGDPDAPSAGSLPVIRLGGADGKMAAGAAPAAEMDARMIFPVNIDYVWAGDDAGLPTVGQAFRFVGTPTADDARRLADALGVQGEVKEQSADFGGGWVVGPNDGSAPSLTLSADGLGSWWYSGPMSTTASAGCAVAEPAIVDDTTLGTTDEVTILPVPATVAPCPEPQPPVGILTADEARQRTLELLGTLGVAAGDVEIEPFADQWSAYVTVYPMLDGARTQNAWSFGFGENGVLSYASGSLNRPEPVAEYPLIGCAAGVQRLNDQQANWSAYGPTAMAKGGGMAGYEQVAPAGDVAIGAPEPMPVDPAVSIPVDTTPVVVTLTSCRIDRTMQWDVDGTVWLLPAYTYTAQDGGEYTVIAIGDEYLAPAEPVTTEPVTTDTVIGGTVAPEPEPTPATTTPVDPTPSPLPVEPTTTVGATVTS
jgi:hypothetical protein